MKIKCISEGFFDNALKTLGMAALSGATKGLYNYSMAADFKLPQEYFAAVYFHTKKLYNAEKVNNEIKQSMQQIFSYPTRFDYVIDELAKNILPGEKDYKSLIKKAREAAVPQPSSQATAASSAQATVGTPASSAQVTAGTPAPSTTTVAPSATAQATPVTVQPSKPISPKTNTRSNRDLTIPQLKINATNKALKITNIRYLKKDNTLYMIILAMLDRIINNNRVGEKIIYFNNNEKKDRNWNTIKIRLQTLGNDNLGDNNYVWTLINYYLDIYINRKISEHQLNKRQTILELFNKIAKDADYQRYKSKREISTQQTNIQAASALRKMVTNMLIIYLNRTDTLLGGKLKEYTQTLNRYLESSKFADRDPEAKKDAAEAYNELKNLSIPKSATIPSDEEWMQSTHGSSDNRLFDSKNPFSRNFIFEAQYDD